MLKIKDNVDLNIFKNNYNAKFIADLVEKVGE